MSDKMYPIPFSVLLDWILNEYFTSQSIFGIPAAQFYLPPDKSRYKVLNQKLETVIGPAAGPHTQLSQNIASAYLTGGRFMELKTVQIMDELHIEKPCIYAQDEGYNIEWSQELKLDQSFDEYLKAWLLIHFLKSFLGIGSKDERGYIFNMSVGYDLKGIKKPPMDNFIEKLKNADLDERFNSYKKKLIKKLHSENFRKLLEVEPGIIKSSKADLIEAAERIDPHISDSVTLSTMHGCPPDEIEAIAEYLISEKELHTFVKLNPTLLGFGKVQSLLSDLGFEYIKLDEAAFENDLKMDDALPMIKRIKTFADKNGKEFGVKLSNTLGVKNDGKYLAGKDMYMSGRNLYPLTINLASNIAEHFNGDINISYSGGANEFNISKIYETGIMPITTVTELLKPGGYYRLTSMAKSIDNLNNNASLHGAGIRQDLLKELAASSITDKIYQKGSREIKSVSVPKKLQKFDCYAAPCQYACPIEQDVAEYIRLINEERFKEAFELIVSKNPLPHITGYICDHQCMFNCTRWDYDEPVLIRDLKLLAAEKGYSLPEISNISRLKKSNVKAAVIGAGPAGLSAAYFLAKGGLDVTIFEKGKSAGGVVQNIIPDFRLPHEAIEKDIELIKSTGVKFVFNADADFSITALRNKGFKYIFIGIGAGKSNKLNIPGDSGSIINALDFLKDYHSNKNINLGKSVAVIGGGNSAMDGARAALRCPGTEKVYIIYRRTQKYMPADKEEYDTAMADGVRLKELLIPHSFESGVLKCSKMKLGGLETDGRRAVIPLENKFKFFNVNTIISAIGEKVDVNPLKRNSIPLYKDGKVIVDTATNETRIENVFFGGDALRGPSTIVDSIADGRKAADEILKRENVQFPNEIKFQDYFDPIQAELDLNKRKGSINTQIKDDFLFESDRCLECNFICNKCVEVCPNRANLAMDSNFFSSDFKDRYQILHLDALCNECGNCDTFCPYNGSPYKDKLTLFWSEKDFYASSNDGFYLIKELENELVFIMRAGKNSGIVKISVKGNKIDYGDFEYGHAKIKLLSDFAFNTYMNYKYLFVGNS